jgi:hypothetical protein
MPTATILARSANSITFAVDDVEPARELLKEIPTQAALASTLGTEVEACSGWDEPIVATGYHPLIAAAFLAFSEHRPLVLSPDIIWLTIAQGLAQHINNHAEELRHHFVSFPKGKATLTVEVMPDAFQKGSPRNPWPKVFSAFGQQIKDHVGGETHSLFVANFSTTGPVERAASEVVMMEAFKRYFDYVMISGCGIPQVTLEGTTDDWLRLRQKVQKIGQYDLDWWTKVLIPICDQFIETSQGKIDHSHWQNLCKSTEGYGTDIINGWIAQFILYVKDASNEYKTINPAVLNPQEGISTDQLELKLSVAPFTWAFEGSDICYLMECLAGFVGVEQNHETLALRPRIGWAIRDASQLKRLIHRLRQEHAPRPVDHEALQLAWRHGNLPGDLLEFYHEMDGALLRLSNQYNVSEILPFKNTKPMTKKFKELNIASYISAVPLCKFRDQSHYFLSSGDLKYDERLNKYSWRVAYMEEPWNGEPLSKERLNKPRPIVAQSFTEFLERLLESGGELFHLRPGFQGYGETKIGEDF